MMRTLRPISLSAYAGIYIGLTLGLFALLGWLTLEQMERSDREIRALQLAAAEEEFQAAVASINAQASADVEALADWDEVHQQLSDPTYYAYWRGYRLLKSELLSPYTRSAHIYDAGGRALAMLSEAQLPNQIEGADRMLVMEDDRLYLYVFEPVYVPGRTDRIKGFVGVKMDFVPWFIENNRFYYLDETSFIFELGEGEQVDFSKVGTHTRFALRSNPQADTVREVMETAVVRLALTISLLAVLFYVMQAVLLAIPLRRLTRDIDRMKDAARPMNLQHADTIMPIAELEKVRQSLTEYQAKLREVHTNLDEKNKTLWEMAHHDPLTGAYNRRAFDLDWSQLNDVLSGRRLEVAFLLFDCNHFKAINDSYGHQVGDQVIQILAQRIRDGLRSGDRLYRLGGDEFATILLNCNEADAGVVAERCADLVSQHDFSSLGIKEPVRLSIGVSLATRGEQEELNSLHWQADVAMYRAKRPDSPHIQFYRPEMGDESQPLVSSQVVSAVYEMLRDGQGVEMHYQPITSMRDGRTKYFEALARLRYQGALMSPGEFLPVIETRRLELEFDLAILESVLLDLQCGVVPEGTGVSINLSGHSVVHPRIFDRLTDFSRFRKTHKLVLEVTETALIRQLEPARRNLDVARRLGFEVALDDFGSGYSSLRYLGDMPVDVVKFDISMIQQMARGGTGQHMMERIAALIKDAGYRTVAEGIETPEVYACARAAGFDAAQGYLIGRPGRPPQLGRIEAAVLEGAPESC